MASLGGALRRLAPFILLQFLVAFTTATARPSHDSPADTATRAAEEYSITLEKAGLGKFIFTLTATSKKGFFEASVTALELDSNAHSITVFQMNDIGQFNLINKGGTAIGRGGRVVIGTVDHFGFNVFNHIIVAKTGSVDEGNPPNPAGFKNIAAMAPPPRPPFGKTYLEENKGN